MIRSLLRRTWTSVAALGIAAGACLVSAPANAQQQTTPAQGAQQKPAQQTTTPRTPVVPPGTRIFKATMTQESSLRQQEADAQHKAVVAPSAHKASASRQAQRGAPTAAESAAAPASASIVVNRQPWWTWSWQVTPQSLGGQQIIIQPQASINSASGKGTNAAARKSR